MVLENNSAWPIGELLLKRTLGFEAYPDVRRAGSKRGVPRSMGLPSRVAIDLGNRKLDFDLDHATCGWTLVELEAADLLDEAEFPLIALLEGKRYELYSDHTFAEVELP